MRRIVASIVLGLTFIALAIDVSISSVPLGVDFHTYEAAAQVGLNQGWMRIYDQALVAAEQERLVPDQLTQPFISPPTVAWLVAALAPLPYWWAYYIWAAATFAALAASLVWSATSRGLARWIAVGAALAPWWVLYAVHLGQVAPLVAAAVVLSWRLVRDDRSVAAALVLSLILLKPNTAFLVPFALLAAARYRVFATWAVVGAALSGVAFLTLGTHGTAAYLSQLTGQLPTGAAWLTVEGALGVSGPVAIAVRFVIVAAALVAAFRLRGSPGLVIVAGILGSLLATPYLHASDLCLLAAAAWIAWEQCPSVAWRLPLAAGWLAASPFAGLANVAPTLSRWALAELLLLAALMFEAWRPGRERGAALTPGAEVATRAPA
ncbi:MAG TPA: glycosyltransferase family 87 protein [Candidatus Dormibacteraeota bacterium]